MKAMINFPQAEAGKSIKGLETVERLYDAGTICQFFLTKI